MSLRVREMAGAGSGAGARAGLSERGNWVICWRYEMRKYAK